MSESSASAITGFSFLIVSFILIRLAGNQLAKKNAYRPRIIKIIKHRPAPTNPATGEAALEEIHEAKA
jgi:positive regulator of sigma E activity